MTSFLKKHTKITRISSFKFKILLNLIRKTSFQRTSVYKFKLIFINALALICNKIIKFFI